MTVANLVQEDSSFDYTVCALGIDNSLVSQIQNTGTDVFLCNEEFKFDPNAIYRLYRFLSEQDIDILHTHLPYAQVLGRLVASQTGIDTIVSTQHTVQDLYHPVTGRLERVTASMDDVTVAVSEGVKQSFLQNERKQSRRDWSVIHNGIDVANFHQRVITAEDIAGDHELGSGPIFLNVGRCVPPKAQSVLIDAMPMVIDEIENAHLLIAGDGELKDQLEEQVIQLGLEEYITLLGQVTPIEPYYAIADVFVLPSRQEGLPVTALEAMAAELAVVGTEIPGLSEVVIDEETGYLVPPEDPARLAEAMVRASEEPSKLGYNGKKRAESEFSIQKMTTQYKELYKSVT